MEKLISWFKPGKSGKRDFSPMGAQLINDLPLQNSTENPTVKIPSS